MMDGETVSLIIKAPNQKYDDLKIECQLSWTILDLKIYLCKEYPSKPNINDQRLIYSGHLLKNEQHLRDIIQSNESGQIDASYTFHLVCPQRQTTATETDSNNINSTSQSTPASPPPQPQSQSTSASGNGSTTINGSFAFPAASTSSDSNPISASFVANPLWNHLGAAPQDNAAMHESYNAMLSQYYQYMSYMHLTYPPISADYAAYHTYMNSYMRSITSTGVSPMTSNGNHNPVNENNQPENGVANNNANNRNANIDANNANNNNNDNEDGNLDWAERLFSFSKAMVMLSIMYIYSSFGRLLLLITIGVVLYLYKNARLPGIQNNNNNNNNNNDNNEQQIQAEQPEVNRNGVPNNNNNNNNNENQDSETQQSTEGTEADNSENQTAPPNSRFTGLRLVWVFVASLFTSLIPDPAPIN